MKRVAGHESRAALESGQEDLLGPVVGSVLSARQSNLRWSRG